MRLKSKIRIFALLLVVFAACEYPLPVKTPGVTNQLVVDGFISTDDGPYTVNLYITRPLEAQLDQSTELIAESKATVYIKDDQGNSELLTETETGIYQTSPDGIKGQTGRSYHVDITTSAGKRYSSTPEEILPVGHITNLTYEYEPRDETIGTDYFRVFVDAEGAENFNDLIRFRMVGTYEIETHPELATKTVNGEVLPAPWPCSGYIVYDTYYIRQVAPCECCFCWINEYNDVPALADEQLNNNLFNKVEVGKVPINQRTFYNKYRVEVQQLSLTPESYQFWKLIRAQKLGTNDLFQPAFGKVEGNIVSVDSDEQALGIFWAAGVNKKAIYINRSDVPYEVEPIDPVTLPCTYWDYIRSTGIKPSFWMD